MADFMFSSGRIGISNRIRLLFKSVNRISWRDGSVGWRVVAGSALRQFVADHLVAKTRLSIAADLAAGACESKRSSKLRREGGVCTNTS